MQSLTLTVPDDWHSHLRDEEFLQRTVTDTARFFKRAIIMPNLKPPVISVLDAEQYNQRILQHIPDNSSFTPLLTLYLTPDLTPDEVKKAKESGIIYACKLYPQGATTNSDFGVSDIQDIYPALEAMQKYQLPLLIHGEIPNHDVDIFDREKLFIETTLIQLQKDFPDLKMVLEHISTRTAVDFVLASGNNLAATITPQHLLLNRNDILAGGIKPHNYCLPIAKREEDRLALRKAATSGNSKFFLGTDSAPHTIENKETSCGCAGTYTAFHAIPLYLEVFDDENALEKFEGFASIYGAEHYGLPINSEKITFKKQPWTIPESLPFGNSTVVPLLAEKTLKWQLSDD
jgi:dihydroorotase